MNPYSGTSTLARVMFRPMSASEIQPTTSGLASMHLSVQVLRVSAAGIGLVYGSTKLGYLKASKPHKLAMQTCRHEMPSQAHFS